jgi:hypothetical protein
VRYRAAKNTVILRMFATLTVPSVEASHNNETCQRSTVIMKGLRQASGQGAPAPFLQEPRLVDRLDIAPLVDGAHRRVRAGDRPMTSTPTEVGEDADLGEPPVVASPPTQAAVAGTPGSTRRRFLAAVRAWAAAGQLGPDYYTTVGRYTGARC